MLKIRLRRMGSRHRPFYRVVVSDGRRVATSSALDELGYYDPRKKPTVVRLDFERLEHWLSKGAQPSSTVRRLMQQVRRNGHDHPVDAPVAPSAEPADDQKEMAKDGGEEKEAPAKKAVEKDDTKEAAGPEKAEAEAAEAAPAEAAADGDETASAEASAEAAEAAEEDGKA